jgi:hypothetical protein
MVRDVWTTIVARQGDQTIYVANVPKGTVLNKWLAQKVMNAVWAKVPLENIDMAIVVIDGEPHEQPTIGAARWQLMKLDW